MTRKAREGKGAKKKGQKMYDSIKETQRVMVEMGMTCVAEEGWWEEPEEFQSNVKKTSYFCIPRTCPQPLPRRHEASVQDR